MKLRMSFLVTRPPRPVPWTCPTSTPCSEAIRATTGETKLRSSPPPPFSAGAGAGAGAGAACCCGASGGVSTSASAATWDWSAASWVAGSGGGSSCAGAAAPEPITASLVPTSTVSPSWTRICWSTPLPGLGTSVSTLSVEISSSGSSAATSSPSCLSHFVIVPSETETPIWGITTSTAVSVATLRVPARRLDCGHHAIPHRCASNRNSVLGEIPQSCDHVFDLGDVCLLERRRERDRRVRCRHALDRRVEVLERVLRDRRRDLRAEPARVRVLVEDEHLRRLAGRLQHRRLVPRDERPQVEDLHRDPVAVELLGGLLGRVDHGAPRDDGQVAALAVDARLPERRRVTLVRNLALDPPVEVLVLEVEHRVGILDCADDQALGVLGRRRAHDLQAGDVRERALRVLAVERPAGETAARRKPDDDRHGRPCAVALLRRHRDEVIPRARDEVRELHLRHRAHAHDGRTGAAADDGGLGQGRIDYAPGPELVLEPERDLERPAVDAHVLADDEDALVAPHLLAEAVRNRLEVRLLGHATRPGLTDRRFAVAPAVS